MKKIIKITENQLKTLIKETIEEINGGGKIIFTIEGMVGSSKFDATINVIKNKLTLKFKLKKIIEKLNLSGFTLSGPHKGMYKSKDGKISSDTSYSLESLGINSEDLIKLADELITHFPCESVLIYDYNKNKKFFYNKD